MEFLLGGVAACGAGFFTNPLEVVKTRMQLQGELKARGQYTIHYRNVFHAFYAVGRYDGLLALQKGLIPALWYQFFMNGCRLGAYQCFRNWGLTQDRDGNTSVARCVVAGATAGCIGAALGSPLYMVKTHLQALANQAIAVGHQNKHSGMFNAFHSIYSDFGVRGLWRGVSAAIARVMVGSASQLATFTTSKEYVVKTQLFHEESWMNAFVAANLSGVAVVMFMTPLDVVSTRIYNQKVDQNGRGVLYKSLGDCISKIFKKEGIWGFYKGWVPSLFRLGPHTVLSLVFWDQTRKGYQLLQKNRLALQD